jgi:hypothetical protein
MRKMMIVYVNKKGMPVSIGEPASFPKNQNHENKKAKIMFKLT